MTETAKMARELFRVRMNALGGASLATRRGDEYICMPDESREVALRLRLSAKDRPRTYCYGHRTPGGVELEPGGEVPREDWPEW